MLLFLVSQDVTLLLACQEELPMFMMCKSTLLLPSNGELPELPIFSVIIHYNICEETSTVSN